MVIVMTHLHQLWLLNPTASYFDSLRLDQVLFFVTESIVYVMLPLEVNFFHLCFFAAKPQKKQV